MQNVIDKIEWMFAGLGGFLGWFFGGFDGFLYALVVFVVCDYFTGVLAAAIKHELSSEVGFKGIYQLYSRLSERLKKSVAFLYDS